MNITGDAEGLRGNFARTVACGLSIGSTELCNGIATCAGRWIKILGQQGFSLKGAEIGLSSSGSLMLEAEPPQELFMARFIHVSMMALIMREADRGADEFVC